MDLINYITPCIFGVGSISQLGQELRRLNITLPLIVTDAGIINAGILAKVQRYAGECVVFDGTDENPTEQNLLQALALFTSKSCDGIIAVGGGSAMDLAKAVALIASQGGQFSDYDVKTGGSDGIQRVRPHIAIPTSAGTGAEIGRACVLTTKDGRKRVAVSLNMVAHGIICDPELTLSLPARLTAATGIDALSHGIEAFVSTRYNPPADAIALDAISRITSHIERAVSSGDDIIARTEMLMGALQGGMVLQKGLGSAHAMATPLGELHIHHGTLIGVLLPHVLEFNDAYLGEKKDRLRHAIGLSSGSPLSGWLSSLVSRLGLPCSLKELGVQKSEFEDIAAKAEKDHLSATNPRPASKDDYLALLNSAYHGRA